MEDLRICKKGSILHPMEMVSDRSMDGELWAMLRTLASGKTSICRRTTSGARCRGQILCLKGSKTGSNHAQAMRCHVKVVTINSRESKKQNSAEKLARRARGFCPNLFPDAAAGWAKSRARNHQMWAAAAAVAFPFHFLLVPSPPPPPKFLFHSMTPLDLPLSLAANEKTKGAKNLLPDEFPAPLSPLSLSLSLCFSARAFQQSLFSFRSVGPT